jgi:beta-aspartyl-peptidase (threonine type)
MPAMSPLPLLVVHGGAGAIPGPAIPRMIAGCREAARRGWEVLRQGGSALAAAEAAVVALEDNPLFNAGTGSVLNSAGEVEMDAAIMDGSTLSAGAVAAVGGIKNPVALARRVLEDGRHLLLAGEGARLFARRIGFAECDPRSLITDEQLRRWRNKHGTVGCVALDVFGRTAAATSTGGTFDKLPGRVGDSPLPGCGTYADENGAASCTGDGEAIIRVLLAKTALDLLGTGSDPADAGRRAIARLEEKTGGRAGLILLDRQGRFGWARNTAAMPVCALSGQGETVEW